MKSTLNFIFIFICLIVGYGQNDYLEVHYNTTLDYDQANLPPLFNGRLKTTGDYSIFEMTIKQNTQNSVKDSSFTTASGSKINVRNKVVYKKSKGFKTFKKNSEGINIAEKGIRSKRFLIVDSLNLNWNVINDSTKSILGYTTYLAKTHFRGHDYHAYFAPDIPLNDGPFKFYGLPGLILEIWSADGVVKFIATEIKTIKEDLAFTNELNGIKTAYDNKILNRKDFVEMFKQRLKSSSKYKKSQSSGAETYKRKSYSRSIETDLYTDN